MTDIEARRKADEERKALDAYLGKNIRLEKPTSSLMKSTSEWLNHPIIREVLPIWLLRKNGPDFPVEADHTLGLSPAFDQVIPPARVSELIEEERRINTEFDAWIAEGFVSTYTNEDFFQYEPGTVGGIIAYQIREHGFDLTLGVGNEVPKNLTSYDYWKLRSRQSHDFEHILTGGQFNSLGEVAITWSRVANQTRHLSPDLAAAVNPYQAFAGLRMVTRAMLHYPETLLPTLRCLEQGIAVGIASPPFWFMKWEEVFHMTPADARVHFGVPPVEEVDTHREAILFRQDPEDIALAAE